MVFALCFILDLLCFYVRIIFIKKFLMLEGYIHMEISPNDFGRLKLLSEKYSNIQAAATELINLQAITNLPKGTEHFISDLHGEYETFYHIINNASGAIREKIDLLFSSILNSEERAKLSTLIYYPVEKLNEISVNESNTKEWYRININRLIEVCRLVASKYTRSKVRKALHKDFAYIIEELLQNTYDDPNKTFYYNNIIDTIIDIGRADAVIIAICDTIKRLIVDHLHIVGDIFDRGPRADIILDSIIKHHSIDIQWGNHDIIWMGAACGNTTCISVALCNSINYNNLEFLEEGYGINLRPLAFFASKIYKDCDVSCFKPKNSNFLKNFTFNDMDLISKMYKAISIIRFKLEGQTIKRNPQFKMDDRLLLHRINYEKKTICIDNIEYTLKDIDFPTVDKNNPYRLTPEEDELISQLQSAFLHSEKLQRHIKFIYTNGNIYKCYNSNLLLHGCIPLNKDGSLMEFYFDGKLRYGKEFLDYAEYIIRQGYFCNDVITKKKCTDFLWYLWCGKFSPLFGKDKMTTFERLLIDDKNSHIETKNAYYKYTYDESTCRKLLELFGLCSEYSHIINGHIPVKSKDGEQPVRANGKLIVIDGGFCRAYQATTGTAGYTLVYNSYGLKLCSHASFEGIKEAINNNTDIFSTYVVSEKVSKRITVGQTDKGLEIISTINDLKQLLNAYRTGLIEEIPSQ